MKNLLNLKMALGLGLALLSTTTAKAELVVAWDQIRNSNGTDPSNYVVQDGIDVIINRTGAGVNANGSTDGTIGNITPDAPATVSTATATTSESYRWVNGGNASFDFVITDTSGTSRDLGTFHFDAGATRPNAASDWELFQVDGATATSISTGAVGVTSGTGVPAYESFDIPLGSVALAANDSVTFRLAFTGGTAGSSGHHGHLDNVGISAAVAIPEPSSLALLGVAGVCGMVRRRKK